MSAVMKPDPQSVQPSTEYIYLARLDWLTILSDLHDHGCSGYRVSVILGVGYSTVQGWFHGHEPRWAFGQALLDLHRLVCGEDMTKFRYSQRKTSV